MKRTWAWVMAVVTVVLLLALPGPRTFGQIDHPNPPPEPRPRTADVPDVSASGAMTTRLPVALPAARGPVPNIGLSYGSDRGNGLAGVGWHLSGFPAITRGRDTGMRFDASDVFVFLPGGWGTPENPDDRLVNVSGRYYRRKVRAGSPPDQFRPSAHTCGHGPCYWEMRDGTGTTYYFGGDAATHAGLHAAGTWPGALWEPNNGVTRHRGLVAWPLYKVVDPDGNYLVVTYNQVAGSFYPLRVEYNLPRVGAQGRAMSVHFQYENRPDRTPMPGHHSGRLKNIRIYGEAVPPGVGVLIRRYELGYATSEASGRSLLTSFREFGRDGDEGSPVGLEAKTFSYTPDFKLMVASSRQSDQVPDCQPGADVGACTWQSFVGDLDADGKADFVRAYYGTQGGRVLYRCGGAEGLSAPITHSDYPGPQPPYVMAMGDFNGDGRQDLVAVRPRAGTLTTYIAYGEHARGACSLGGWILQPSQTVRGTRMAASPQDWRILAADLDGDGMADVVLFDRAHSVLYWTMYRGGQLSATSAGRYRSGAEWASCNAGYPYAHTVGFNGIDAADVDGDGKADIVASWSRRDVVGTRFPGMISMLTAPGTAAGLGPPTEACHTPASSYPTPAVRYPYTAMRQADINGDGRGDSILTYQGQAIQVTPPAYCLHNACSGAVHGRDIRVRLGASGAAGSNLQVYAADPASYPHASAHERPPHLNDWAFATADINGDGIDDYIQSYAGVHGDKLYYALGSPTGLGPLLARVDSVAALPDGGDINYPKTTVAVGDFNGDGLSDVARIALRWIPPSSPTGGGRNSTHVDIYWASASGLVSAPPHAHELRGLLGGHSNSIQVLVADLNGDGRDDLLLVNNSAEPPSQAPAGHGAFIVLMSRRAPPLAREPVDDSGVPDLLSRIDNGVLGTTTVTYRLARDYSDAIKPDWPTQCLGVDRASRATGYVSGAMCGRIASRPRPLARSVVNDHGVLSPGVTFKERLQYDYTNGRVYGGPRHQRADLGFSLVVSTDLDTGASTWSWYRQDKPFEGLLDTSTSSASGSVVHRRRQVYSQHRPWAGVTAIGLSDSFSCPFEEGAPLPCLHRRLTYHAAYLLRTQRRSGTDDIAGDRPFVTNMRYHLDGANWLFRLRSSWTVRRNPSGATLVLDMRRITYDSAAGKSTRVLRRERILFDDAEAATCAAIEDPWDPGTCRERILRGEARWVTTFMTESRHWDARGNLTWFGRYPVARDAPNPAWPHPVALTYDAIYSGLVASITNAVNHTTTYAYDAAGRLLTVTDANHQTTVLGYDVYGRPETYAPPGVGLYQKRWVYAGVDPRRGYEVQEFTYASSARGHQVSAYFDGFGALARTRDHTETAPVPLDTVHHDAWRDGQRVRRESWPHYAGLRPAGLIETTFDARGRPLRIARVKSDASFTTATTVSGRPAADIFAYGRRPDGLGRIATHTDANGARRHVHTDHRGLVTQVTDAGGDTTYTYSTALRLARVTFPSTGRGRLEPVDYTWDSWGRLKTVRDPHGEGVVAYTYDDASKLTRKTYFASAAMTTRTRELWYFYDPLDRLRAERTLSSPSSDLVTYSYDEAGHDNGISRLTSVRDTSGTTAFHYDPRGNLARRVITLNGLSESVTYHYAHDDRNMLTGVAFPGAVQKFSYTADGILTGVLHNGATWGRWSDFDVFKRAATFEAYDDGGWTNSTVYTFDADQRVARIIQKQKSDRVIQDLSYGYDAVGNVITITDNRTTKVIGGVNTDATRTFAYDALNRLCAAWEGVPATIATPDTPSTPARCPPGGTGPSIGTSPDPPPAAGFTYDGIGNLLTDSGTTNTYTTVGPERVIENRRGPVLNWRASHDTEGKRTRFEDCSAAPCVVHEYGYDYRGRLATVTQGAVVRERYEYDFGDRRTRKSYDSGAGVAEAWFVGPSYTVRRNSGQPSRTAVTVSIAGLATHTYGDRIAGQASAATVDSQTDRPFTGDTDQAVPPGIYLRQPDLLGSLTVMTRASDGAAVSRNRYDPWGDHVAARSLGQDTTHEEFTGQPREHYSSLDYYGFRYYHPRTRRFLTPDDRFGGGDAQGYNRFAYVRNNPTTYVDPTGHQEGRVETCPGCTDGGGAGGGSGAGQGGDLNELCNFSLVCSGIRWIVQQSKGGGGDDDDDRGAAATPPRRPPKPPAIDPLTGRPSGPLPQPKVIDLDPAEEPTERIPWPGTVTEEVTEKIKPVKTAQTTPSLEEVPADQSGQGEQRVFVDDYCISEYCRFTPLGWQEPMITPLPGARPVPLVTPLPPGSPSGAPVPVPPRLWVPGIPVRIPVPVVP